MPKITFPAKIEEIRSGINFIEEKLKKAHFTSKQITKSMLAAEESMVRLISHADPDEQINLRLKIRYGVAHIYMFCKGEEFPDSSLDFDYGIDGYDDPFNEESMRSLLLHAFQDDLDYSHKGDYNYVELSIGDKEKVFARRTLMALILGTLAYLLLLPILDETNADYISNNILIPIQTIYLNALQLITGPVVFFSMMVTTARYRSVSGPTKVGKKVIFGYVFTSLLAVFIGLASYKLLSPLTSYWNGALSDYVVSFGDSYFETTSILSILVNIVPSNIISPFLNVDPLQLLCFAIICGLALGKTGKYSERLTDGAESLNKLFTSIVSVVSYLIPFATFFTVVLMLISFGFKALLLPLGLMMMILISIIIITIVYIIILAAQARLNPFILLKKYLPVMPEIIFTNSSIEMIQENIKFCKEKLGVSPKVSSFSIPFGAVANMDGNCIYLIIAGLFLAQICGVDVFGSNLIKVLLIIIVLSIGAPTAPGSVMVFLALVMSQMGISITVISVMLVINAFIEMGLAAFNTIGDLVITVTVAASEGQLDKAVYKSTENKKEDKFFA